MKYIIPVVAFCFCAGCVSSSLLTREERQRVVARARELVHVSGIVTKEEEKQIDQAEPRMAYYFMAGPEDAQYSVRWILDGKDELVISGDGDIFRLEGAHVERKRPNQPPEITPPSGATHL